MKIAVIALLAVGVIVVGGAVFVLGGSGGGGDNGGPKSTELPTFPTSLP